MTDKLKVKRDRRFNKHMTALGHLCAMWAALEHQVDYMLWELANVERKAGACFTAQLIGPGRRGRALLALVRLRKGGESLISDVNKISRRIEGLGAQRDRFVHDPYVINTDINEIQRMVITADRAVTMEFRQATVEEIDELSGKVQQAIKDVFDLRDRLIAELPPWPRTQFEQSHGIASHRKDRSTGRKARPRPPPSSEA